MYMTNNSYMHVRSDKYIKKNDDLQPKSTER